MRAIVRNVDMNANSRESPHAASQPAPDRLTGVRTWIAVLAVFFGGYVVSPLNSLASPNVLVVGGVAILVMAAIVLVRSGNEWLGLTAYVAIIFSSVVVMLSLPNRVQWILAGVLGAFIATMIVIGIIDIKRLGMPTGEIPSAPREPFPPPWFLPGLGRIALPLT